MNYVIFITRTVVRKFQKHCAVTAITAEKFSEIQIHIDYYTSIFPKSQGVLHNIAIFSDNSGFIPDRGLRKYFPPIISNHKPTSVCEKYCSRKKAVPKGGNFPVTNGIFAQN